MLDMRTDGKSIRKFIVGLPEKNAKQRDDGIFYMNLPKINPQLRKKFKDRVIDYVFIIREVEFGPNIEKVVDMECYDNEVWNSKHTMNSMSILNARVWWNRLIGQGFERL